MQETEGQMPVFSVDIAPSWSEPAVALRLPYTGTTLYVRPSLAREFYERQWKGEQERKSRPARPSWWQRVRRLLAHDTDSSPVPV